MPRRESRAAMGEEIIAVFDEMAVDEEVRVTILTGAGRGFCAGAYVKSPKTHARDSVAAGVMQPEPRSHFPWDYPKPLIGAIKWDRVRSGPEYRALL